MRKEDREDVLASVAQWPLAIVPFITGSVGGFFRGPNLRQVEWEADIKNYLTRLWHSDHFVAQMGLHLADLVSHMGHLQHALEPNGLRSRDKTEKTVSPGESQ